MITRKHILKWCFIILLLPAFTLAAAQTATTQTQSVQLETIDIEVFVREGCPHCARAEAFLNQLKQEQPGLRILYHDVIRDPESLEKLQHIAEKQRMTAARVPAFVVGGQLIVGFSDAASTGNYIRENLVKAHPKNHESASCEAVAPCETKPPAPKPEAFAIDFFGYNLSLEQVGLPLFTVAMGLLDGFNPCSMWVLILMISPSFTNNGTLMVAPVSKVTVFCPPVAVSPLIFGGASVILSSTVIGKRKPIG